MFMLGIFPCNDNIHLFINLLYNYYNFKNRDSPDKCFLDKSSLSFLNVSVELPSMTTKQRHIKQTKKKYHAKRYIRS